MKYQKLGKSGIDVSVIALGTWGLGGGSVWSDRDSTVAEAESLLDACRDFGINYIDTAPVYGTGESERLLGEALKGRRHDFVLQTKCSLNWRQEGGYFHYARDGYTVDNDTRPDAIRKDVEDSLRRLKTDYLDSVIVHYVTDRFPAEDTVGALEDLIRAGKIRAYGLSNSQPKDLDAYCAAPDAKQGASLVQEFFSVLSPFHGRKYFDACRRNGATFQTYGVLEEGFLTSPDFLSRTFAKTDIRARLPWNAEPYRTGLVRLFEAWTPIKEAHRCSFAALAEAWALAQFDRMSLLVGMRKPENVADTAACLAVSLTPDELRRMEEAAAPIQVAVLDK